MQKLFAYGTLRVGEGNAGIIEAHANYTETVETVDKFIMATDTSHCFPFLISCTMMPEMSAKAVQIVGDVYDITEQGIGCTDKLEGHPRLYIRTPIKVRNAAGDTYEVLAYLLSDVSAPFILNSDLTFLDGDWKACPGRIRYV